MARWLDGSMARWLDGELVEMEDLVLHEEARDIRSPSHALTIARDVLQTRRRIAAQPPDWALSPNGLRCLQQAGPAASFGDGGLIAESENVAVFDAVVDQPDRDGEGENIVWMTGSTCPVSIWTPSTRFWHSPKPFWPKRDSRSGCRSRKLTR
jgi:hypothetical protein